jgi:hypothetical protein
MSSTLSPTLARAPGAPTHGAERPLDQQLFVISTHKVRDRTGTPPFGWVPYGVEHAWQPGARRTLCGQWTSGWTVFWDRKFTATPSTACPACVEASLPAASRRRLDPLPPAQSA